MITEYKETNIVIKPTASVDNVYALFKSSNKTVIGAFKAGLNKIEDETKEK